jgi:hypothetical protein
LAGLLTISDVSRLIELRRLAGPDRRRVGSSPRPRPVDATDAHLHGRA